MIVTEFKELDKPQLTHLVYCIIDRIDYCANDSIKEMMRNISDWTLQNITIQGYTVLVSKDEDSLLQYASALDFTHAVVLSTGTEFINGYHCFELIEQLIKENFFIAGHILDRDNAYYELHHQCYVINLETYADLNYPQVGQQTLNSTHTQTIPNRSIDTYHDSHTPVRVTTGTELKEYEHRAHGWNILSVAWSNNKPTLVFKDDIRNNKTHYYPEYIDSYMNEISFVYKREAFCSGLAVYPFNSEQVEDLDIEPIEQLIVPASGLNWMLYVDQYCTEDVVVKFYDYSLPTLNFIRTLIEQWNGIDYVKFVQDYLKSTFGYISNSNEIPYCGPQDLDAEWNKFESIIDWNKICNLKVEYHWVNLLDTANELDWIDKDKTTLVNASNVFNYIGTIATHNLSSRIHAEKSFVTKLKKRNPGAHVLLGRRANTAFETNLPSWYSL